MSGIAPADVGLRVGYSSRESISTKARRYLIEGRIRVRYVGPLGIQAHVTGTEAVHVVTYRLEEGWGCSCPARSRCAHLEAVQLVVAMQGEVGS